MRTRQEIEKEAIEAIVRSPNNIVIIVADAQLEVLFDIRDLLIQQRDEQVGHPYDDIQRHRTTKQKTDIGTNDAMKSFLKENPDLEKKLNPENGIMKQAENWEGRDE